MGENNNDPAGETTGRREGTIDFSRYSTDQLVELRDSLDPAASPQVHAALVTELDKRITIQPGPPQWTGRLTAHGGLPGWLQGKWRRQPLYGEGVLIVDGDTVTLSASQRTWLGMPIERALTWSLERIRNVVRIGTSVRFEVRRRGWFPQRVQLELASTDRATALAAALPQTKTARFERLGLPLLAFEDHLQKRCRRAWFTPALVLINTLLFAAACISVGQIAEPGSSRLVFWSANIGPLTLDGQWWRLLTAVFTHGSVLHLVLNMWALWHIGRLTERLFGRWRFLSLYLANGVLASLFSLTWDPARSSVGASGAIFGMFGAFLAVLMLPHIRIPRGIFRAHWIPTLLFTAYNLISGAMSPGVDNAAHVGGLVCGLALGFLLARPVDDPAPSRGWRPVTAAVLAVASAAGALLYLRTAGGPPPAPQQFANGHQWYVSGEARNLAAWERLGGLAAAGAVSDEELGTRFNREIAPFWEDALPKLRAESLRASGPEGEYLEAVIRFVEIRRDWVRAIVKATRDQDKEQAAISRGKIEEITVATADIQRLALRANAAQRMGGLTNLAVTGKLRRLFDGKSGNCIEEPPDGYYPQVSKSDSRTDGPAMAVAAGCTAQHHYLDEDFRALDALLARQSGNLDDLPGGGSSLHASVNGVSDFFTYGMDTVDNHLRRLAEWRRTVPDSGYPDLLEAMLFSDWAWSARGHGTSKQVSQQAWAAFGFRTEMSWLTLQGAVPAARQNPLWCNLSLRLLHDRSAKLEELRKTLDPCIKRFPRDLSLYTTMVRSLMPRWFGSAEDVAAFINEVTGAGAPDADELYARLYSAYASMEQDDVNIFDETRADWTRMKSGFERLLRTYPRSDAVLNAYARFACLAGDQLAYRSLRTSIDGHVSATSWSRKTTMAGCDQKLKVR